MRMEARTDMKITGRMIGAAGVAALGVVAGLAVGRARQATTRAGMALHGDWEGQLKSEHRRIKRQLKAMVDSEIGEPARRAMLLAKLAETLDRHALEEETVIYPALKASGGDEMATRLYEEHAEMKALVSRLQGVALDDPAWAEEATALRTLVTGHIREEERDLFPLLHDLGDDRHNAKLTKLVRRQGAKLAS